MKNEITQSPKEATVQIVHFTNEKIGSFDWELPADLAERMKMLPAEMQAAIRQELESHVKSTLFMLMGALKMGAHAEKTLNFINEKNKELLKELISQAKHLK